MKFKSETHLCACGGHVWAILDPTKTALVDPEFEAVIKRHRWRAHKNKSQHYLSRTDHFMVGDYEKSSVVKFHKIVRPVPAGYMVDHINRNTLDNRSCNLRVSTSELNARNCKTRIGSSKYRGVTKRRYNWAACITVSGLQHWLGRFDSEESAARAYDAAALVYFGPTAQTNFARRAA